MKTVNELKKGEYFTLKEIEYPKESQVYVRGDYDRGTKTYSCTKWNASSMERRRSSRNLHSDLPFYE